MDDDAHDGFEPAGFEPGARIDVGDLVAVSARVIGQNLVTFVAATTLVMSPTVAANVVFSEWSQRKLRILTMSDDSMQHYDELSSLMMTVGLGAMVVVLVQVLTWYLAQAPVVYVTVEHMAGRRAGLFESLGGGLRGAVGLGVIAIVCTIFASLGAMLCLVPGLIVMTVFFAAIPAAVAERLGPIDALQRSADLTLGHRLTVFGLFVMIVLSYFAASWVANQLIGLGGMASADPGDPAGGLLLPLPFRILSYAVHWALMVAASIPLATVSAVFYARVRGIRDGVDAEEIASVFS